MVNGVLFVFNFYVVLFQIFQRLLSHSILPDLIALPLFEFPIFFEQTLHLLGRQVQADHSVKDLASSFNFVPFYELIGIDHPLIRSLRKITDNVFKDCLPALGLSQLELKLGKL